jgi:alpha-tubulin suppressor-like RCC1 family protein
VWATGGNSFAQLGLGSKKNSYVPVKIPELKNVKQLSTWHFSAAVTIENSLFVWGTGIFGEYLKPTLVTYESCIGHS